MGDLLFLAAIFATLTSWISVLESIVANCVEIFHTDRKKTVVVLSVIYLAASAVIALLSTILIGWVKSPQYVIGEMERNGETFRRRGVYTIMIRYIAPDMMFVLFLQSTGILSRASTGKPSACRFLRETEDFPFVWKSFVLY